MWYYSALLQDKKTTPTFLKTTYTIVGMNKYSYLQLQWTRVLLPCWQWSPKPCWRWQSCGTSFSPCLALAASLRKWPPTAASAWVHCESLPRCSRFACLPCANESSPKQWKSERYWKTKSDISYFKYTICQWSYSIVKVAKAKFIKNVFIVKEAKNRQTWSVFCIFVYTNQPLSYLPYKRCKLRPKFYKHVFFKSANKCIISNINATLKINFQ